MANYSDRRICFLREEIPRQKLTHILYQLTYSESNYGCQEGTSEAARDAGWTAAAGGSRGLALAGQAEQRGGWAPGGPSASPQHSDGHAVGSRPWNNNSNLRNSSHRVLSDCCMRAAQSPTGLGRLWSSLVCCFLNWL